MTCDECFEAFSASVDGNLGGDEHEAMNEHLDGCADCQRLRTRMLDLSAEMKGQPFPEAGPEQVLALTELALAGVGTSRWGWLRQALRIPYESWPWRLGLRLGAFGGITALVALSAIVRWLLPPYGGVEAAAKSGLPKAAAWLAWAPSTELSVAMSVLVFLLGAWTCGLPALLADLFGEARMGHRQVATTALSLAMLGPFVALPLLAELEVDAYVLACSLWIGACLVGGFALVAFQTLRPLPRLAVDFVALVPPLAALEWLARASMTLPSAAECQPTIALLVGSVPFGTLAAGAAILSLALVLLGCGLSGLLPAYRGSGGRPAAALLIVLGLGALIYGFTEINPRAVVSPVRAEIVGPRRAYLLASGSENAWLLPGTDYPRLEVNVAGPGTDPRAARLRLASAYLGWDEPALLRAMTSWADNAPGVAWGLSAFVDSLGRREGPVLSVPTEERQRAVAHLLVQLRWRVLAQSVLSPATGSVRGTVEGVAGEREGLRLRLIEVEGGLPEVMASLAQEVGWARELAGQDDLGENFSVPEQRTTSTGVDGEFEFPRVPDGRYVLALVSDQPASLTYNSTVPGMFEVSNGGELKLPPIRLTSGGEGEEISLEPDRWDSQGPVEFSITSAGPSCRLEPGATAFTLVETEVFHSGTARIKILSEGQAGAVLQAKLLAKDGRAIAQSSLPLEGPAGLRELEISSKGREGYLQLLLSAGQGPPGERDRGLQVTAIKLEVLP